MRVAVYHNLPPGGARRVLCDFLRWTAGEHEYELYTVDLGGVDGFAYARDRAEQHDPTPHVSRSYRYPVLGPLATTVVKPKAWRLTAAGWMARTERAIAADINRRHYDVALVHPCQVTQAPSLLRYLEVPSLHYMQEYRRRSFEAGYQAPARGTPLTRRAVAWSSERVLRARDRAAVLAADRIACNSCYTAESIQRAYGREVSVCSPGIDTETFSLGPAEGSPDDRATVLSVGSLEEVKGHDLVVRATALLPPATRPSLEVVYERCDDRYRHRLEALAASSGVELRLHPGIADAELVRRYRQASVTVVAARLEPLGLVPLESLACGTPVVAVREAGYRETVRDGVNGYLVERSPSAVAEAMARVMQGGLGRTGAELRASVVPAWDGPAAVKPVLELLTATADQRRR
jgi:glycosyltransferase involved in cell wall biosynthesis